MNDLVTPDKHVLSFACQQLGLPELNPQEQRYLLSRFRGLTQGTAARASGMATVSAKAFEESIHCQEVLTFMHEHAAESVGITREKLTLMLLDAHDLSATSGERVSAIRELGQLHSLYPQKGPSVAVQINNNITNEKQLEKMSDEDLLKLSGNQFSLEPGT